MLLWGHCHYYRCSQKRRKPKMCFFILWLDLLLIIQSVKLLLKHCCLLPCSLSRGLKAWIATHPPPLHQKPETSARGFFCSPLGHVWFPGIQGLERIRPGILLNFIRPCIAGIRSGQEWPQPNGPLPILAKITKMEKKTSNYS